MTPRWFRETFADGYTSGDVLAEVPDAERARQETQVRGSYRDLFERAVAPHLRPGTRVLEVGPGRGSWTRAILARLPGGTVDVVDLLDFRSWMPDDPRLTVHCSEDGSLRCVPRAAFDFLFSFGVLCHLAHAERMELLRGMREAAKPGAVAIHHYGDWRKFDALGWDDGCAPAAFREQPDHAIWWPRNDPDTMAAEARETGWRVVRADLGLLGRDSIAHLEAP